MSEHITPLYLDQAINVFFTANNESEEEVDELNGYEPPEAKKEPEVGSDDFIFQAQVEHLKKQALPAKELQDICLAIDELIGWRLMEDVCSKDP